MEDLDLLIDAARGAARIATRHWHDGAQSWEKADRSPVTEADLEVDAYLKARLTAARPDYGWLSEETPDDSARHDASATFIVDPIDGTRAFAAGERSWAHSLAVAHDGEVTAAVVHLPLPDKLYTAARGKGAWLNGKRLSVSQQADPDGATLLASGSIFAANHWTSPPPRLERAFRPALAYRLALVAEGRYDALLTLRAAWEWDIAAGSLLVEEAGGIAAAPGHPPHRFNSASRKAPSFLAANPVLYKALTERLSQLP